MVNYEGDGVSWDREHPLYGNVLKVNNKMLAGGYDGYGFSQAEEEEYTDQEQRTHTLMINQKAYQSLCKKSKKLGLDKSSLPQLLADGRYGAAFVIGAQHSF